ncbi:MAG: hypothetical protein C5S52_06060 [ANME-2 cluster archaeon]|nr:hypothetical protein [ANME-2 cluster archaeon]
MFTHSYVKFSLVTFFVIFSVQTSAFTMKFPSRGTVPSEPHDIPGDMIGIPPQPSSIRCLLTASLLLARTSSSIWPGIDEKSTKTSCACRASSSATHDGT